MALAAALVLAGISVVLLSIYGADVVAIHGGGDGFLPFDHMIRGLGLGGTSIVLPIVAFFISRNEPSRPLGAMILIAGVMIIIGGAVLLAGSPDADAMESGTGAPQEDRRDLLAETAPILAAGIFIVALGAVKLKRA